MVKYCWQILKLVFLIPSPHWSLTFLTAQEDHPLGWFHFLAFFFFFNLPLFQILITNHFSTRLPHLKLSNMSLLSTRKYLWLGPFQIPASSYVTLLGKCYPLKVSHSIAHSTHNSLPPSTSQGQDFPYIAFLLLFQLPGIHFHLNSSLEGKASSLKFQVRLF